MKSKSLTTLMIIICLQLSSCVIEDNKVKVDLKARSLSNSSGLSSVNIINNQLIINGSGLDSITDVKVNGTAFNEAFTIESKTPTQIVANGNRAFSFDVSSLFDLVLSDAHGAATFPITFDSNWTKNGSHVYYNSGYVGIGRVLPAYPLHLEVSGTTPWSGYDAAHFGSDYDGHGITMGFNMNGTGDGVASSYVTTNGGDLYLGTLYLPALTIQETTQNVGIGTSNPNQKLEVNGGVKLSTVDAKPACSSSTRGTFWVTQGAAGVKDNVEVCAKDAADAYAWRTLY